MGAAAIALAATVVVVAYGTGRIVAPLAQTVVGSEAAQFPGPATVVAAASPEVAASATPLAGRVENSQGTVEIPMEVEALENQNQQGRSRIAYQGCRQGVGTAGFVDNPLLLLSHRCFFLSHVLCLCLPHPCCLRPQAALPPTLCCVESRPGHRR